MHKIIIINKYTALKIFIIGCLYLIGSSEDILVWCITAGRHMVEVPTLMEAEIQACSIHCCYVLIINPVELNHKLVEDWGVLLNHLQC